MRQRTRSLPLLTVVALVALVIGTIGTAAAGPALTKAKVKKIATKVATKIATKIAEETATEVVRQQAPSLSVANANTLAGQAPAAFKDDVTVYTVPVPGGAAIRTINIPLAPGNYQIGYSAYLFGGSGTSFCQVQRVRAAQLLLTGDDGANTSEPSFSGVGVVDVLAGDVVRLRCSSATAWTTLANEPIQIVVTPLDSVTHGTLTAARGTGTGGR